MPTVFAGATFEGIELGLIAKLAATATGNAPYKSAKITVGGKPVAIFIERPDIEHFPDRIFPAITFEFDYMIDHERRESYVGSRRTLSNDPVPIATQYPDGEPYKAMVRASLQVRNAQQLRELEQGFIDCFRISDYIIDPNGLDWWIFRDEKGTVPLYDPDQKTYLKIYMMEIDFVYLPKVATAQVSTATNFVVEFTEAGVTLGEIDVSEDGVTVS